MLVSSGLEYPAPQPRFDIDRGDVIVRTGTGPVGMCLNTLTSVLGGYSTVVTVHGSCPPKGIVPLHCRSDPSMPDSEARNMLDRLRGLMALVKLPSAVFG